LDKIPNDGETAKLHAYGYTFEILEVKDQIISLVRVTKDSNGEL
jgi:putative hemolysin